MNVRCCNYKSDFFYVVPVFMFVASQDIGGLQWLRGLAEGLLLLAAICSFYERGFRRLRELPNMIFLGGLGFVGSAIASVTLSPVPMASFQEIQTPLLKYMIFVPIFCFAVLTELQCRGWSDESIAKMLLVAMLASGLGQVIHLIVSYVEFFGTHAQFPDDPFFHRYRVGAMLIVFPFVLMSIKGSCSWVRLPRLVVSFGLFLGILTSNSRGAWLGMIASVLYLAIVYRDQLANSVTAHKKIIAAFIGVGFLVLLILLTMTSNGQVVVSKITVGFDTSQRWGNGVWGATMDMIRDRPWFGYGYGDAVYAQNYNAQAVSHPEWTVQISMGAHNAILAHWVAFGLFGLAAILGMYLTFFIGAFRLLRIYQAKPVVRILIHCCVASFVAYYLVRGQFEIARWNSFGILMALMVWLFGSRPGMCSGGAK